MEFGTIELAVQELNSVIPNFMDELKPEHSIALLKLIMKKDAREGRLFEQLDKALDVGGEAIANETNLDNELRIQNMMIANLEAQLKGHNPIQNMA